MEPIIIDPYPGVVVPRIDPKDPKSYEHILQQFGAANFENVVQRNLEKDFIERQAALLSVANMTSVFQRVNGLTALLQATAGGGVKAQFPIDAAIGGTGRSTVNAPLVSKQVYLDKANVTYRVLHEAIMEAGPMAENDQIAEGVEQLGAHIDNHYITGLVAAKFGASDVTAAATWVTTGDPFADINKAINNIVKNSAINPNAKKDAWMTVIAPIQVREALEKITIVDGIKIGLSELISQRLGAKIVYTRAPFNVDADIGTWPLLDKAIVIPTLDRHVGKFYTFDGGAMPSMFVTEDENGKRVSTNSWMKWVNAPDEADGTLTSNRRIVEIASIA